jgi:hypothetical protein
MAEPRRWIAWQGVVAFVFVTLCLEQPWWIRALLLIPGIAMIYAIIRTYDIDTRARWRRMMGIGKPALPIQESGISFQEEQTSM